MFCGKSEYLLIEKTHKRALKILYNDFSLSYRELLEKSGSVNIHVKHLQQLMTEIYKTIESVNPLFMKNIFSAKEGNYNLRNQNLLKLPKYKDNKIWNQISFF